MLNFVFFLGELVNEKVRGDGCRKFAEGVEALNRN